MTSPIRIDPKDLRRELKARERALRESIRRGTRMAARRGKALLMHRSPVDLGELKASWRTMRPAHGGVIDIVNTAPHAGIVEAGARPHAVSEEGRFAIYEWVRRHFPQLEEKEQQRITSGIVWKLRRKGQRPTWFVRDSMPDIERFLGEEIDREIAKLAQRQRISRGGDDGGG